MNDNAYHSIDFGALTRAGEGLTQWRALAMGFITVLACGVIFWLMQFSGARIGGIVGVLLMVVLAIAGFVVWVAGASAVGVLLMDKARNLPLRSIGEAARFGLGSVPKFLLLGAAVMVAIIVFMLVAALIYFVCKIPVIGAVLAFVAHPLLVLVAAGAIIACMWVVFPLFAPAVWSGLNFRQALASVFAIARNRLVQVVLMMMVLYIILAVVGMLIATGVFPAMVSLTGMATNIMGGGYNTYGQMGGMGAAMAMFSNASMVGALMGLSVLGMLLFALVSLVAMMGVNVLYLQAADGLDTAGTASDIEGAFGMMKEKAREAADKAKAAAERAKQAATERSQAAAAAREQAQEEMNQRERDDVMARFDDADRQTTQQEAAEQELAAREAAEREAAAREAAARAAAEREAQAAHARAEAQRQAAARAAAPSPDVPPAAGASGVMAAGVAGAAAAAGASGASGLSGAATRECRACHHTIDANDAFCEHCGAKQDV
ncbi:zinc ribbon domain-containing protein [Diaphorobacter sp.]|uniref:zinc ribbon domain-containing protein n=1 Tax=Diaphorobacter sp. TaxID=1934310 RepID=UPI0028AAFE0B|nr:zinc ribbon domain-containing protein [Diaphorobacter sp.]